MRFQEARKLLREKGYAENDPRLKRLPKWLKEIYIKEQLFCEETGSKEDLEIHRIKRGNKGGLYNPDNVKVLAKKRHKMHHYKEPGCR